MIEFRSLKSGEEDRLIKTAYEVFKDYPSVWKDDEFRKHDLSEKNYHPSNVKVAVSDSGEILSHVVIREREMNTSKGTIKIGGIGMVGTLMEYRKRGYTTKLLNLAIEEMEQRGYDASMLFTANPYFNNSPWKPIKREFVISKVNKIQKTKKDLVQEFYLSTEQKRNEFISSPYLVKLEDCYDQFSKNKNLLVERNHDYWKQRIKSQFIFPDNLVCLWDNKTKDLNGYFFYTFQNPLLKIVESAWVGNKVLESIVSTATDIAKRNNIKKIGMFGDFLEKRNQEQILYKMDNQFITENLMMLPLSKNLKIPSEPVIYFPTDHF